MAKYYIFEIDGEFQPYVFTGIKTGCRHLGIKTASVNVGRRKFRSSGRLIVIHEVELVRIKRGGTGGFGTKNMASMLI